MLKTTEKYAETISNRKEFDTLSDVMKSLRISGSILLKEDYAPPWAIAIPDAEKLRNLLKLGKGVRPVDFHFVQRGHIVITQQDGHQTIVEAGEMAICFGGAAHWISQGDQAKSVSVETMLSSGVNMFQPTLADRARSASLICGVFLMHDVELNPLFMSLPSIMHFSASRPSGVHNMSGVLDRIALEINQKLLGGNYAIERLLELLYVESLRAHVDSASSSGQGWFSGLKDPVVGKAMSLIHARPGNNWSVDQLAENVAMSPSRFAARFSSALGESPMAYVAKWRMNVAGRLLNDTREPIGKIAADVGYENVPAFNRAFKKHLGMPPAAWRAKREL